MQLLVDDPGYLSKIQKNNAEQVRKIIKSYQKTHQLTPEMEQKSLKRLGQAQEIESQNRSDKKYADKRNSFAISQGVFENKETEIYTLYRFYCRETHNNLGALLNRHIDNNEIILFKRPDQEIYDFHIINLAFLLVASASIFFQHVAHESTPLNEALSIYKTHLRTND